MTTYRFRELTGEQVANWHEMDDDNRRKALLRDVAMSESAPTLVEAIETVNLWLDMWEDEQVEIKEPSDCDHEERKVIQAMRKILRTLPKMNGYVAWVRWNGRSYQTCDSSDEGAFRVCRYPKFEE